MLQHFGNGIVGGAALLTVHGERVGRKFCGYSILISNAGSKGILFDNRKNTCKALPQCLQLIGRKRGHRAVTVHTGAMADFLGSGRGQACQISVKCFVSGLRLGSQHLHEILAGNGQWVFFALGFRQEIIPSRQNLPDRADSGTDMFDRINNQALVITENQVAVFSHQFQNQVLLAQIPHLVQMLHGNMKAPLQSRLGNLHNPGILEMLAQQHTETRRRHGTGFVFVCEIDQRQGGIRRKQKPVLSGAGFDGEQKLVRLCNFIDTPAQQGAI